MADEFIVGLVGGLVALALLLLLLGGGLVMPTTAAVVEPEISVRPNITGATFVGFKDVESSKRFQFEYDISNALKDESQHFEKRIYNGLLFGSDSVRAAFHVENMESFVINLKVKETNELGSLIIKVDNQIIYTNTLLPGDYEIPLDLRDFAPDFIIEIYAESSQWQIWAPTVYDVDVTFVSKGYSSSVRIYNLVFDNPEVFTKGQLLLRSDVHLGDLAVQLNGKTIFNGSVERLITIPISKIEKQNVLLLYADKDGVFEGAAVLALRFIETIETKFEMPLNISQQDYSKLPGEIRFKIVSVEKPGGFAVRIMSGDKTLYSDFARAEQRSYRFVFTKTEAQLGANRLIIEAVDGSAFWIKDLQVIF